ncbi:Hypp9736 [Branchiostoma lanceolatum]|uniref:Hypp9736 protein n=1 Tax=Branchiostoma lanceolatum TaxID=7740 RepID=A0A8S4MQB1_BRALA|nr:Hypp9736 [Branchiostoma lanceolatum]
MEVQFFLMESNRDKTPQPAAEAAYVAAGLGPKTVTISTSMDHKQVELRLIQAYPKLRQLPGGWLLKKVYQGGSGSRPLIFAPAGQDGYPGKWFQKASKTTKFYVAPMQFDLPLEPLPDTAEEFLDTPKTECKSCSKKVPIPLLVDHLARCETV